MTFVNTKWPAGDGKMAHAVRITDWSRTALGSTAAWTPALRIATSTVLDSALPSILVWGHDLIQIYNDAYMEILGLRHPLALGQATRLCWPEAWAFNEPIFRRVMDTGVGELLEDQEYQIEPSGVLETRYFTLGFSAIRDEAGAIHGVLVVVQETTQRVLAERENRALLMASIDDAERMRLMFAQAPTFVALLKGPDHVFEITNEAYLRLVSRRPILGLPVRLAIPEAESQGFVALLDGVYASGEPYVAMEMPILLDDAAGSSPTLRRLNFVYQPIKDQQNRVTGIFVAGSDMTPQYEAQQEMARLNSKLTEKLALLHSAQRRKAFQISLAHYLRPLSAPDEIASGASKLLGEHLGVSRVVFCDVDALQKQIVIRHQWAGEGITPMGEQAIDLDDFGPTDMAALRCGEVVVHNDVRLGQGSAEYVDAYEALGIRATLSVPLIANDKLTVIFNLHQSTPRDWSVDDIELAQDVAEWTWSAAQNARAQAELLAERDQSQHTFDNMAEGFALIDRHWRVLQMNSAGLQSSYRTAEQVIGKNHWEVWPEMVGTELQRFYQRVMGTGVSESVIQQARFANGRDALFEISAQRKTNGGLAVFFRDITEREKNALALQQSQAQAETALEIAELGTFTWNALTDEASSSDRSREIFGFTDSEGFKGADFFNRMLPEEFEQTREAVAKARATDGRVHVQFRIKHPDGSVHHVICQGAAEKNASGQWERCIGVFNDVTQREEAAHALRNIDRRKDEFLGMLAHELRNPLAPIVTAAEILRRPGLDRARINDIGSLIQRQSRHMTALLADLLDVSRIKKGLVSLARTSLNLKGILSDAIEQTRPLIDLRNQSFNLVAPAETLLVKGDKVRLVQVFSNILNNAAKYTPAHGTIDMTVTTDTGRVSVSVKDNGCGIDQDLIPHIFDIFTQAERSSDRHLGGLGLGLSLVKHLTVLQGGTVVAKSAGLGHGAEFVVSFPLLQLIASVGLPEPKVSRSTDPASTSVMVVDDNIDAAKTLAALLEIDGYAVCLAHTAEDALRHVRLSATQVFILDIGLPGMDGYALARQLRAEPSTAGATLIALTGYGQQADRARSKAAGFDCHFEKPVDGGALLEELGKGR